nr:wall-associated receptor kinase 2-like [Ipomoea batatas]
MEVSSPVACWCCVFLSALAIALSQLQTAAPIARPGCLSQCGNLAIPYPFGIGSGCAFDSEFEIFCDTSFNPPNTVLTRGWGAPILVYDISDTQIRIPVAGVLTVCYDSKGAWRPMPFPFNFTSQTMLLQKFNHYSLSLENKFTTVGCDDSLLISEGANDVSRCTSRCSSASQVLPVDGAFSGIGCCQLPLPKGVNKSYNISMVSAMNHTKVWSFNPCAHSFFGDTSRFRFLGASDLSNPNFPRRVFGTVSVVLDWAIGILNCKEAQHITEYACKGNSHCVDSHTGFGGGFNCSCFEGYFGDGKKGGQGCILINKNSASSSWFKLSLGIGLATLVFVALATSLSYIIKKTNDTKMRLKFFEQNGGFLLEQKITDGGSDGSDVTKIFSAKELRQATNNFALDMILGEGGNGIVFKGILLPNNLQVAVKRSKTVDTTQIEQFINEVVILSRINHRHVVKLLGCCLEAEVPLLVYEYISNGSLHHHIHREAGGSDWLSWENRLRIAIEAAGKKPAYRNMSEDWNLSSFFVRSLNENRLFQIIVPRLVREGTLDQLKRIAELVKRCLEQKGEDRPQMKEVASELERIRNSTKVSWTTESSCLLPAEDESLDLYAAPINHPVVDAPTRKLL